MHKNSLIKLKIYAMTMRLKEIACEIEIKNKMRNHARILTLSSVEKTITNPYKDLMSFDTYKEYYKPKKIHPKHQRNNKYRFK